MSRTKKEPTIDAQLAAQPTTQQIMAKINLNGTAMLPIHVAHQIQALLAEHAVGLDYTYRAGKPNVEYITTYNAPTVEVLKKNLKLYDATMLTWNQIQKWATAIREGEGDSIMEPADFAALTGEE